MTPLPDPTPLVSILIPTYNRPELLALTLRSALEQTYEHLEILVNDDASPSDLRSVVEEVADGDPRVRYFRHEENKGNLGNSIDVLLRARGDYCKLLLDDDLLMPEHVEKLVTPMIDDPTIALAFSKRYVIDEHGERQPDPPGFRALSEAPAVLPGIDVAQLCLRTMVNWVGEQTTVLYPRRRIAPSRVSGYGGADVSHVLADLGIWMNLMTSGNVFYTPEELSAFRQHGGQVTNRADTQIVSLHDSLLLQEHFATLGPDLAPAAKFDVLATLLSYNAQIMPPNRALPQAEVALDDMARIVSHLGRLHAGGVLDTAAKVSIVIETGADAAAFMAQLQSVAAFTAPDAFEVVVVVDSAAPDQTRAIIEGLEGDVQVVTPADLVSRAEVWRLGIEAAHHDIVVLLDPGVRVLGGWLPRLLDVLDEDDDLVIANSALCLNDRGVIVDEPEECEAFGPHYDVREVQLPYASAIAVRGAARSLLGHQSSAGDAPAVSFEDAVRVTGARVMVNPSSWTLQGVAG